MARRRPDPSARRGHGVLPAPCAPPLRWAATARRSRCATCASRAWRGSTATGGASTGEALGVRSRREQGMGVLARSGGGERGGVDVAALAGDCLVIGEVKPRRSSGFGEPVEAVTFAKARRLRRLAAAYLAGHGDGARVAQVRVDVVGILCPPGRPAVLRHVVRGGA